MADAKNGARFVRCPKCMKVIVEFASIPVYQCGGCKTTLQAKHHNPTEQNGSGQLSENNSGKLQNSGSVTNELSSRPKEKANDTSQVRKLDTSQPISSSYSEAKGNNPSSGQVGFKSKGNANAISQSSQAGDTKSKDDNSLNVEVKKHLQPCEHVQENLKSSEGLQESTEHSGTDVSCNFGKNNGSNEVNDSPKSTYRDSTDYDHRISSSADGCDDCFGSIPTPLLVKTPSQGVAEDSTDAKVKKAGDATELTNSEKANGSRAQLPAQDPSTDSFHKRNSSASMGSRFIGDADVMSTKYKFYGRQSTSLDSEDFYSIYNWFEPEKKGSLRSLARDAMLLDDSHMLQPGTPTTIEYVERIRMEITKKVDELKDEINDLFSELKNGGEKLFPRQSQNLNNHNRRRSDLVHNSGVTGSGLNSPRQHRLAQDHCYLHCCVKECNKYVKLPSIICSCNDPYGRYMPQNINCRPCCATMPQPPIPSSLGLHYHSTQKYEHGQERLRYKEKRQNEKRHLRPVLGGAPFVICHNCLKLLQLPLDFSTTRKKLYKLQCSACCQVLFFSFGTRNCSPYQTSGEVHLPSKVDNIIDNSIRMKQ